MVQYKLEIPGAKPVIIQLKKTENAYIFVVDNIWVSEEFLTLFNVSSEDRIRKIFDYLTKTDNGIEFDAKGNILKLHCDLFEYSAEFQLERRQKESEQTPVFIRMISYGWNVDDKEHGIPKVEKFFKNAWELDHVLTKELHRGIVAHQLKYWDAVVDKINYIQLLIVGFGDEVKKANAFVKNGIGKLEDFPIFCRRVSYQCCHYEHGTYKLTSRCPISDRFQKYLPFKVQMYSVYLRSSPVVPPWQFIHNAYDDNAWCFCD